ncbi:tRNA pseudouridine synthase 1 [Tulasnella sp. 408]|nr:tRNA pseudouridine synthase 1 [Tulasnella sp. 408]
MKDNMDIIQRSILDEEGFDLASILTKAQAPEQATFKTSDPYAENPFDLFPRELVSAVFRLVSESRIPLERYQVPGRLAPTCRRFRDIVYDSPELWTTVVVRVNVDASHLPSYLTHSRNWPLHIDTHLPGLHSHNQGGNIKELVAPVLNQAHRWESLTGRAFHFLHRTSLVDMVPASLNLSRLSRLSLSYASPGGGGWVECIVPQYPNLQILEISDFYINPRNIHVTTLQELVLKTMDWSNNMVQAHSELTLDIFSRLPSELVSIIFSYVLSDRAVPLRNHRAPALLIPVCRRFRDIVYDSPELWTAVVISERGGFRHLPDYLARSSGMPIDVTMYPLNDEYQTTFLRRAGPVLAEKRRWRSVVIGMRRPWRTLHSFLPPLEDCPVLTRLSIQGFEVVPHEPPYGLEYVIPDYSRLRVLDISEVRVAFTGVQTTRLEELGLKAHLSDSTAWAALSSFLNHNPSLRRLKADLEVVEAQDDQPPPFSSSTPISLPSLTVLEMRLSPTTSLNSFLQTLNIPKLSHLSIGPSMHSLTPKVDFTGFIATCVERFNSLKKIILDRYNEESYKIVREDSKIHKLEDTGIVVIAEVWVPPGFKVELMLVLHVKSSDLEEPAEKDQRRKASRKALDVLLGIGDWFKLRIGSAGSGSGKLVNSPIESKKRHHDDEPQSAEPNDDLGIASSTPLNPPLAADERDSKRQRTGGEEAQLSPSDATGDRKDSGSGPGIVGQEPTPNGQGKGKDVDRGGGKKGKGGKGGGRNAVERKRVRNRNDESSEQGRPDRAGEEGREKEGGEGSGKRLTKRKVAMLLSFCGTGCSGMQFQHTGERTIEGLLFEAFVKAGAISQDNSDHPAKVDLQRAARTDAGVHAAGNVVSFKMIMEPPIPNPGLAPSDGIPTGSNEPPPTPMEESPTNLQPIEPDSQTLLASPEQVVSYINSFLPPQIRVWSFLRTRNTFNCRKECDSRRYEYLFPSWMLLPPKPGSSLAKQLEEARKEAGLPSNPVHPIWEGSVDEAAPASDEERQQIVAADLQRKRLWRVDDATLNRFRSKVPDEEKANRRRDEIDFSKHQKEIHEFKLKLIYERMREEEAKSNVFNRWIQLIDYYQGEDLAYLNAKGTIVQAAIIKKGERRQNALSQRKLKQDATGASATEDMEEIIEDEDETNGMKGKDLEEMEG